MNQLTRVTARLSAINIVAAQRGFVGAALDGFDVDAAIADETKASVLAEACDIAERFDERHWWERLARRHFEICKSPSAAASLALILALTDRCGEAGQLLDGMSVGSAPNFAGAASTRRVEGVLLAMRGEARRALALFRELPGHEDNICPAPIVFTLARELMARRSADANRPFFEELVAAFPKQSYFRCSLVRCLMLAGDWDRARELATRLGEEFGQASLADSRNIAEARADLLAISGKWTELFDFVLERLRRDPAHWAFYYRAMQCALSLSRAKDYSDIIAAIPASEQECVEALMLTSRWLLDFDRLAEADEICDRLRPMSPTAYLHARVAAAIQSRDQNAIRSAFTDCERCGVSGIWNAVSYGLSTYYCDCTDEKLRHCLEQLEHFALSAWDNLHFWLIYLRCLIALGKTRQAEIVYSALPRGMADSGELGRFKMFFAAENGRDGEARNGWRQFIRQTSHPCVNSATSYPRTVQLKYREAPGSVLLFITLRNGMEFIDWFLDHYRRLGVDHFFIVDNGSTDGSLERLGREPDVSTFFNAESFNGSAFGMVWLNHLMQRFAVGHWIFQADIDEAFVFPGQEEGRSLRELLAYLDRNDFAAVSAIEVDMYPETLAATKPEAAFSASRYFDCDYSFVKTEFPPYVMIQGGIRKRMTGQAAMMYKTPLVRLSADTRFVECNHSTTHLKMADLTAALLHYKFAGDIRRRVDDAILRQEYHFGAASYRQLKGAIEGTDWSESLLSEYSRLYDGPKSLLQNGLIRAGRFMELEEARTNRGPASRDPGSPL